MNIFFAVIDGTKLQKQQKTFVTHFFVVIQHTLTESQHWGQARHSCWHICYKSPVPGAYLQIQTLKEKYVLDGDRDDRSTESPPLAEWG